MYDQLIETFIIVCVTGSFSKAARQLYLSTAAIQKQINQLEKRTGLTLFTRHKNGVVLTSAGNLFYHRALELKKSVQKTLSDATLIQNYSEQLKSLKVGTSSIIPASHMMHWLDSLHKQNIQCNMELVPISPSFTDIKTITNLFKTETINCLCMYHYFPLDENLFDFFFIDDCHISLGIPFSNPLSFKKSISLSDLSSQTIVTVKHGIHPVYDKIIHQIQNSCENASLIQYDNPYTIDIFNSCVKNNYLLITADEFSDGHPNLKTIPLKESFTIPYGMLFLKKH